MSKNDSHQSSYLRITAKIVEAYLSYNKISPSDLPHLCAVVHDAVRQVSSGAKSLRGDQRPAVPISKSVTPDYLICLEDGAKLKMMKRYLRTHFDMSPDEYRLKWGLPADYPMTSPSYSRARSKTAIKAGFGRNPSQRRNKRAKKGRTKSA